MLRNNGHVVLSGRPCKVVDLAQNGNDVRIAGVDIFTSKRYEATVSADVPNVTRTDYTLIDINKDVLSLLAEDGTIRDDFRLPDSELGKALMADHQAGEDVLVSVLSAMDEAGVGAYKKGKPLM